MTSTSSATPRPRSAPPAATPRAGSPRRRRSLPGAHRRAHGPLSVTRILASPYRARARPRTILAAATGAPVEEEARSPRARRAPGAPRAGAPSGTRGGARRAQSRAGSGHRTRRRRGARREAWDGGGGRAHRLAGPPPLARGTGEEALTGLGTEPLDLPGPAGRCCRAPRGGLAPCPPPAPSSSRSASTPSACWPPTACSRRTAATPACPWARPTWPSCSGRATSASIRPSRAGWGATASSSRPATARCCSTACSTSPATTSRSTTCASSASSTRAPPDTPSSTSPPASR